MSDVHVHEGEVAPEERGGKGLLVVVLSGVVLGLVGWAVWDMWRELEAELSVERALSQTNAKYADMQTRRITTLEMRLEELESTLSKVVTTQKAANRRGSKSRTEDESETL